MSRRHKDIEWKIHNEDGTIPTWERVQVAVLMDIRDELKRLNSAIYCTNFQKIPAVLTAIRRNTTKKRRKARQAGL